MSIIATRSLGHPLHATADPGGRSTGRRSTGLRGVLGRRTAIGRAVPRTAALLVAALAAVGLLGIAPAQAAGAPVAPTGMAATLGSGIIALAWADNSSDETGFEIERCTPTVSGCDFAPLATTPAGFDIWADQSNPAPAQYGYRVRAVNAAGASAWSSTAVLAWGGMSGTPVAVITATPTSGTSPLTVAFDSVGSYVVEFASTPSYAWAFGDGTTATGPTASHVYRAPGTYRATLTVSDASGHAGYIRTTITVAAAPLAAPADLRASSTVRRTVDLRWTVPTSTSATSWAVQRCSGSTCTRFATVATVAVTTTGWRDTAVKSGTTYRYRLLAVDAAGASALSNVVTVKAR